MSTTAFAGTSGEVEVGGYLRDLKFQGFDGKTKVFRFQGQAADHQRMGKLVRPLPRGDGFT